METQLSPNQKVPLWQYVSIPSLESAHDISDVLDSFSFSSTPEKDDAQSFSLHYTEWDTLYTLWRYTLNYASDSAKLTFFATANLQGIPSSQKRDSEFAWWTHVLRTPVSGLWSKLFQHMIDVVKHRSISVIKISADVQSVDFYAAMAKRFSDCFVSVKTDATRYGDGWCDFVFVLK